MSTELDSVVALEPEIVSPQAISESIEQCFAEGVPERALELLTPEEVAAVEETEADLDAPPEIETAEEVSLKNGVYHEIKRKLNERYSIPLNEIAFIHEADTPTKKAALFKAVNYGRVRVLLGSTSKLGTGVNVQKRLVALHHVDEPWKPAELEQREGRILRQGNIYPEVFIFHYVTERSFDGYMLQTLESKARFISQILAGEVTARTAEDVGEMVLTVAQVKAIASGNPLVQQRIEVEVKLVKLDRLRASYFNNRAAMRADLEELPERIAAEEAELAGHELAIKARQPLESDSFYITLKKNLGDAETVTFDKRERAGAHLRYLADLIIERLRRANGGRSLTEEAGTYRGFKISIHVSGNSRFSQASTLFNFSSELQLRTPDGVTCYIAQIGESNIGITQSIDYQLRHIEDRLEQTRSGLEGLRARLQTVRAEIDKPWAHAAEYRRLRKEYEEIGASLQSEGIELESNTTFAAEECESEVETASELSENVGAQAESAAADDLGAHRNPFTGLEGWAIVVDEAQHEATDFDELASTRQGEGNASFSFNFEAVNACEAESSLLDEADIFLAPPRNDAENSSGEAVDAQPSVGDDTSTSDGEGIWSASSALKSHPTSTPRSGAPLSPRPAGKKSKGSAAPSAQAGFLWG